MAALRPRFDTNNDGKLTSADTDFSKFKVMVTQGDGSQLAQTLTQLGITEISLRTDATQINFDDGSQITGQTTFTQVIRGITTREVDDAVRLANPSVAKDPVGSVLSRLKSDGALRFDGGRYYEKLKMPDVSQMRTVN